MSEEPRLLKEVSDLASFTGGKGEAQQTACQSCERAEHHGLYGNVTGRRQAH